MTNEMKQSGALLAEMTHLSAKMIELPLEEPIDGFINPMPTAYA